MLKNKNLVQLVEKVNSSMSFVISNKDMLELSDLESINNFLNQYSSIINSIIEEKKAIINKEQEHEEIKSNIYENIITCMGSLLTSLNQGDIYTRSLGYNLDIVKRNINLCQTLLKHIDLYDSFCKEGENEFSNSFSFVEGYLDSLYSILKEETRKQKDLSSIFEFYFM